VDGPSRDEVVVEEIDDAVLGTGVRVHIGVVRVVRLGPAEEIRQGYILDQSVIIFVGIIANVIS
jgi:hypothetical protein